MRGQAVFYGPICVNSSQTSLLSLYSRQLSDNNTVWCQRGVSLAQCWFFLPSLLNINQSSSKNFEHTKSCQVSKSLLSAFSFAISFTSSQKAVERVERNFYCHRSGSIICHFYWMLSAAQLEKRAEMGWKGWKLAQSWPDWPPNCWLSNLTIQGFHQNMSNQ